MLHIGCGETYFDGWINIDIDSDISDLNHDVRKSLPYEDNSADFIYHEHFIEHLTSEEGVVFLKETHRILKKNGIMRIATPDLDYIVFRYIYRWKHQAWIKVYGYSHIQTRAEMMNICFRDWGHQYLYNKEELDRRLRESGFKKIYKQKFNKSKYPELRNRETRRDSRLIFEAEK